MKTTLYLFIDLWTVCFSLFQANRVVKFKNKGNPAQFGFQALVILIISASFSCAQEPPRPALGSRTELSAGLTSSVSCRTAPTFSTAKTKWLQKKDPISYKKGPTLLFVWTFACWNCYRSIPWLRQMMPKLEKKGIQLVSIHSPEFDYERNKTSILKKAAGFKFRWPIYIDNDMGAWRHLNNRYWPAFYIVDKSGCVRDVFIGETHSGTAQAKAVEVALLKYL